MKNEPPLSVRETVGTRQGRLRIPQQESNRVFLTPTELQPPQRPTRAGCRTQYRCLVDRDPDAQERNGHIQRSRPILESLFGEDVRHLLLRVVLDYRLPALVESPTTVER